MQTPFLSITCYLPKANISNSDKGDGLYFAYLSNPAKVCLPQQITVSLIFDYYLHSLDRKPFNARFLQHKDIHVHLYDANHNNSLFSL